MITRRYRPRGAGQNIVESVQGIEPAPAFHSRVSKEPDLVRDLRRRQGFRAVDRFRRGHCRSARGKPCSWRRPIRCMSSRFGGGQVGQPVWTRSPLALTRAEAARAVAATPKRTGDALRRSQQQALFFVDAPSSSGS